MRRISNLVLLAGAGVALVAGGCDPVDPPAGTPTLAIATDATFPPFHYTDDAGATGFDVELATAVARRAGFRPVVVVKPYEHLFTGLRDGVHDLIAATTGITPEREQEYLFTQPYFETAQAILVRDGPTEPTTWVDLRGRRVGASGDGTSARALENMDGIEPVRLGSGEATETVIVEGAVPALENGTIDALIVDEFDAVAAARDSDGTLRVLARPAALESYAFVLRQDQTELRDRLDLALEALRTEGVLDSLRRHFGVARDAGWPVSYER